MVVTMTTPEPRIVEGVDELRAALAQHLDARRSIGFVPTMGALHDGHAELIRSARRECDVVVTSCFVNPTQFGPGEDLARYPRTPEDDRRIAADAGTDVLWVPGVTDVYGEDPDAATRIVVGEIGSVLEGAHRPGHFDGVATVVVRLVGAVQPAVLYLGEKDFQQVVVLRRVLGDLLLPVEVRTVATVREADGLARSSRNAYLNPAERDAARAIPAALDAARDRLRAGERDARRIRDAAAALLDAAGGIETEYVELVDARTLDPVMHVEDVEDTVLLVAARVGSTRLLDNLPIRIEEVRP